MLTIDPQAKSIQPVPATNLSAENIQERYGLQACIVANPQAFFDEIGEDLLLVATEASPSTHIDRRIDLLAIDRDGAVVVIELKRDRHSLQMLQCLSYAALLADWSPHRFVACRSQLMGSSEDEAAQEVAGFVYGDLDTVNQTQRIVLVAEAYDYDVLATGQWLTESHGLDIRCVQIGSNSLHGTTLLTCHRVFPAPQLTDLAVGRKRRRVAAAEPASWGEAVQSMRDEAQAAFFSKLIDRGQEGQANRSTLFFRRNESRMWWVAARSTYSYAMQYARLEGDLDYWRQNLSDPDSVKEVNGSAGLSFNLCTADDYAVFARAAIDGSVLPG